MKKSYLSPELAARIRELFVAGRTYKEIARTLQLSPVMAKTYARRIGLRRRKSFFAPDSIVTLPHEGACQWIDGLGICGHPTSNKSGWCDAHSHQAFGRAE